MCFSKIASILTRRLTEKRLIDNEDQDLYEYALFNILSYLFFLTLAMLAGFMLGMFFESVLFFVSFCLVRNFAGGIHADTERKCTIVSTFSILASIVVIRVLDFFGLKTFSLFLLVISAICLIVFSPIDTPNKKLDVSDKKKYKKKTVLICLALVTLHIILSCVGIHSFAIAVSVSMAFAATLVVAGKIEQIT